MAEEPKPGKMKMHVIGDEVPMYPSGLEVLCTVRPQESNDRHPGSLIDIGHRNNIPQYKYLS